MRRYENKISLEEMRELKEMELLRHCEDYIEEIKSEDDKPYKWDYLNDLYNDGMLDFEE